MYETLTNEDWIWLEKLAASSSGELAPAVPTSVAGRLLEQGFIASSGSDVTITREGRRALDLRRPPPHD